MFVESFECESCQLGKHHRAFYYNQSNFVSSCPFELIHSDILLVCHLSLGFAIILFLLMITLGCHGCICLKRGLMCLYKKFFIEIKT